MSNKDEWKPISVISDRPATRGTMEVFTRNLTDTARIASRRQAAGVASVLDFGGPSGSSIPGILATNSPIAAFLYTISRADKLSLFRYWAKHDAMVGRAIELHSELPMSRVTIGPPKGPSPRQNRQITRIYESMAERIDILGLMLEVSREYWLAGDVYLWCNWSDKLQQWDDVYVLPVEFCFHPDTHIMLKGGQQKRISEVQVGDMVMTHDGTSKQVLQTMRNQGRGKLLKIKTDYLAGCLRVTPEHPVYANVDGYSDFDGDFSQPGSVGVLVRDGIKRVQKVPAASLRVGDQLVFTPPSAEVEDPEITDDLAALMGWYLAEGFVSSASVSQKTDQVIFCLENTEQVEAMEIASLLARCFPPKLMIRKKDFPDWRTRKDLKPVRKRLDWYHGDCPVCGAPNWFLYNKGPDKRDKGPGKKKGITHRAYCKNCQCTADPRDRKTCEPIIRMHDNAHTNVIYFNQDASDFFKREAGTGAGLKQLTDKWMYLPKRQQRILLTNYLRGDGTPENSKRVSCVSASNQMIAQLRVMMARVGADPNWFALMAGKTTDIAIVRDDPLPSTRERQKSYHLRVSSETVGALGYQNEYWPSYWPTPDVSEPLVSSITYDILQIKEEEYFGDVCNLEVEENHSLVAEGAACGQCHSLMHPFNRKKEIIFFAKPLVDTAAVRRITDRDMYMVADTDIEKLYEALGDTIPPELKEALNYGEAVPLNTNWRRGSYCIHVVRNRAPNEEYGESILERCMDTLLRLENLKNSNLQISSRNMNPKHIVTSPGTGKSQMEDLRAQIDLSMLEQVDYPIVANFEINWQTVGANDRLLNTESEYNLLRQDLALGLGSTVEMLTGQASYSGNRITLEMMNTCYLTFRDKMRKLVEVDIFRPVADALGHYQKEFIDVWPRVEPEDIEEGDILSEEEDGQLRHKRTLVNVLWNHSTLRFNRISIRDNAEVYDQLFQLYQKGSVAVRYLLDLHNIDPEENARAILEDMGGPRDPVFNDFMRAVYTSTDMPQRVLNDTDFMSRVIQGLHLAYRSSGTPASGGGGGGIGGGGGLSDMGMLGGGGGEEGDMGAFGGPMGMPGEEGGIPGAEGAGVPGGPGAGLGAETAPGGAGAVPAPAPAASRRMGRRADGGSEEMIMPGRILPLEVSKAAGRAIREMAEQTEREEGRSLYPDEVKKIISMVELEARRRKSASSKKPSRNGTH